MKRLFKYVLTVVCVLLLCSSRSSNPIDEYGRYKGVTLRGNVYFTESWTDTKAFKVFDAVHPSSADLYVHLTVDESVSSRLGHWNYVRDPEYADFQVYLMGTYDTNVLGLKPDFHVYLVDKLDEAGVKMCH